MARAPFFLHLPRLRGRSTARSAVGRGLAQRCAKQHSPPPPPPPRRGGGGAKPFRARLLVSSSRDLPGGAVLGVLEHDAHGGELVADAVGFFKILCLARCVTFR